MARSRSAFFRKSHPVSKVGEQAHIDLVIIEDAFQQTFVVCHITDSVSCFQMAAVLESKATQAVVEFLQTQWIPLMGPPRTLVADQGREFVSWEFEQFCNSRSIYLYHIGVGAPWQNGVAERSGGTLKALVGAVVKAHTIAGRSELSLALGEAVASYNSDVNEEGVSPVQAVTGRQPVMQGDVLGGFASRLAEHSLIESKPTLARQVAIRETARLAMVRLHFSRGLRRAELARARTTTVENLPQPGLMVAMEQQRDGRDGANIFVSFKGQLTKCPAEHVRAASSLEQIAAESWEEAIKEVIDAAAQDAELALPAVGPGGEAQPLDELAELDDDLEPPHTQPSRAIPQQPLVELGGVAPAEIVAALQPAVSSAVTPRSSWLSPSERSLQSGPLSGGTMPGTPIAGLFQRRPRLQELAGQGQTIEVEDPGRGVKRPGDLLERSSQASKPPEPPATGMAISPEEGHEAFSAIRLTNDEVRNMVEACENRHPLLKVQAMAELDRRNPVERMENDHGTWDGRWSQLCQSEWNLMRELGLQLPPGNAHHVDVVQAARKEYKWSEMNADLKNQFREAAVKGWKAYVDNAAVEILSMEESRKVQEKLMRANEQDKILRPRFVMTDKNDGVRTSARPLPVLPSSRLVAPGFRDRANLEGALRKDAPTGSRIAQHLLFNITASRPEWALMSADVKAAFLKGDPYLARELYLMGTDDSKGPSIPLKPGQLARVLFGLADAPREWWMRLDRTLRENGWVRTLIDGATWLKWSANNELEGIIVAHVDDLLFCRCSKAEHSLHKVGSELGFGSVERSDFVWCGKRIRRASDNTVRISMSEYHQNLQPVLIPKHRKSDLDALLTAGEQKQLRAVVGSMQWLVAQLRFDMGFVVSSLQSEKATVRTLIKANQAVAEFQRDVHFELIFRPLDLKECGIMVVTDSALGNVKLNGSDEGSPLEKVYSQACYFVLLADKELLSGRRGKFNVLDARSHRIPRVCRSSYAAELLGTEEAFDVGQLCRGFLATVNGWNMSGQQALEMCVVVDAKDVHDKGNSDTPSYGSQKSLAFTVAWLRSQLKQPGTSLKWTSTENMWADGGTKLMDLTHMRRIMASGEWSVKYCPDFVKQVSKVVKAKPVKLAAGAELPGEAVSGGDELLPHLIGLSDKRGWHFQARVGIQVDFLHEKGYLEVEHKDTYIDEAIGWSIAALGFLTQLACGFQLPWFLNFFLWPIQLLEATIVWTVSA
ncbi:unnamed protein product [Effrenium voratum]|uniref:Integrase catalytic domain-containing protein n=1 Tax=Effrenium voratum TaxID=2562239 RepID=A0AA36NFL6_9DINO|nr:unnamed protein product [Effrenium voratum]